jgi:LysR family glycine cleavage system transcriptional activator
VADVAALVRRARPGKLQPKRWLYFNYAYQMVQAALTGQGVVLARLPLVAESLANGDLIEPLPQAAHGFADGLLADRGAAQRAAAGDQGVLRLADGQSRITRQTIGEVPDPDTVDNMD